MDYSKKYQNKTGIDPQKDPIGLLREKIAEEFDGYDSPGYEPTGVQEDYIVPFGCGEYDILLLLDNNKAGKTACGANIFKNVIWEHDPEWFAWWEGKSLFSEWPYPKDGRIIGTVKNTSDSGPIRKEILKWWPKSRYWSEKAAKSYQSQYWTDTGFSFDVMTYQQDPEEFEGPLLGFTWCLSGDTKILLADGRWVKIKDAKKGDTVISYGERDTKKQPRKQRKAKILQHYNTGKKPVFKVKCRGGYGLVGTAEHKVFVSGKGWVRIEDLRTGDKLCIKPYEIHGEKNMDIWQAAWLGALIGDGMLRNKGVHLTCYNEKILNNLAKMLPEKYHIRAKDRCQYYVSQGGGKNDLQKWLKEIGIYGHLAKDKFIPDIVFKAEKELVIPFLQYLYATDGWAHGHSISYGTTSKRLAEDLHLLLRRFNISAGLKKKTSQKTGVWNDQWWVVISRSRAVLNFCDLVTIPGKQVAQEKVKMEAQRRATVTGKRISRNTIKSEKLVAVKSITACGEEEVYDIEVEGGHNYLANGLLVHNCDEPPPEKIIGAITSRFIAGGIWLVTATPINCGPFLDTIKDLRDAGSRVYTSSHSLYDSSQEDGKPNHKGRMRGLWTNEQIRKYEANTPVDERPARIYGKANAKSGKIYPDFDGNIHIIGAPNCPYPSFELNSKIAREANCFCIMDPHRKGYPAIQWWMLLECGDFICYNEWPTKELVGGYYDELRKTIICNYTPEQISKFMNILSGKRFGLSMRANIMDPRFGKATEGEFGRKTDSLMGEYAKYGHDFELPPAQLIEVQRDTIRDLLRCEKTLPINQYNKPRIYWMQHCRNSIRAIDRHYWDAPESGKATEREAERYKDFIDTIRYMLAWLGDSGFENAKPKKHKNDIVQMPEQFEQLRETSLA